MSPRRLFALIVLLLVGCSRSPQHDFEQGVAYFNAEKFAKAESCFYRALAGSPPTAQALNFLGVCKLHEGKFDEAIPAFQEALKIDPGHAAARYNLALAFLDHGQPDDAIPLLRQIPTATCELAQAYMRASAWGQARQALQKCPEPEALNSLGVVNTRLGNFKEAKENFERCLTATPEFAPAYLNLAVVEHRHLDHKTTALKHYQHYLELQPKSEAVQLAAAQLEQELAARPTPKPIETVVAAPPPKPVEPPPPPTPEPSPEPTPLQPPPAVKRRPPISPQTLKAGNRTKANVYFQEGITLQQQGKLAAAVSSYGKSIATDATFAKAYYNLAIAYRDARQPARALDNYEMALIANPQFTDARFNYAILLQQEGYTVDALAQYERILQDNPNEASVHLTVAQIYSRDRNTKDKARQHYQAYLKLAPSSSAAREIRGWIEKNP